MNLVRDRDVATKRIVGRRPFHGDTVSAAFEPCSPSRRCSSQSRPETLAHAADTPLLPSRCVRCDPASALGGLGQFSRTGGPGEGQVEQGWPAPLTMYVTSSLLGSGTFSGWGNLPDAIVGRDTLLMVGDSHSGYLKTSDSHEWVWGSGRPSVLSAPRWGTYFGFLPTLLRGRGKPSSADRSSGTKCERPSPPNFVAVPTWRPRAVRTRCAGQVRGGTTSQPCTESHNPQTST